MIRVNRSHPLNIGRVAWWMSVPTRVGGTIFADLIANRKATLTGGASWGAGSPAFPSPAALSLDGSSGYASFPQIATLDYPFTMSAWFYLADPAHYNAPIGLSAPGDGVARVTIEVRNDSEGNVAMAFGYDGANALIAASSSGAAANAWNHVVGVFASASSSVVYLNGGNSGSASGSGNPTMASMTVCALGCLPYTTPVLLSKGRLSDCSIWSRALSASEVAQLYAESRAGYAGMLIRGRALLPSRPGRFRRIGVEGGFPAYAGGF